MQKQILVVCCCFQNIIMSMFGTVLHLRRLFCDSSDITGKKPSFSSVFSAVYFLLFLKLYMICNCFGFLKGEKSFSKLLVSPLPENTGLDGC